MKPVVDEEGEVFDFPTKDDFKAVLEIFGWGGIRDKDCVMIGGKFYSLDASGAYLKIGKEEIVI